MEILYNYEVTPSGGGIGNLLICCIQILMINLFTIYALSFTVTVINPRRMREQGLQ